MGAAQQQGVHLGFADGGQQPFGQHRDLVAFDLAALHELHEPWAGGTTQLDGHPCVTHRGLICPRANGAHRGDDPDPSGGGGRHQGPNPRLNDPDHRNSTGRGQLIAGHRGRRGVAGHDQQLGVVTVHQVASNLVGEAAYLALRFGTIGVTVGVTHVDEVLVGQEIDERPGHGEPAETGVEHADGAVVSRHRPRL